MNTPYRMPCLRRVTRGALDGSCWVAVWNGDGGESVINVCAEANIEENMTDAIY